MLLPYEEVLDRATSSLLAVGTPVEEARLQASWLVEADLRGHPSHGVRRLPVLLERIRKGLIVPTSTPETTWRTPCLASVDGGRGLGPPTMVRVIDELAHRVEEQGISLAGVHNCAHLGILAPYLETITAQQLVGVILTTSEALVHPFGGRERMLGTNPIGIGVPAAPNPLVVDLATSVVSMGKVLDHLERGLDLEAGWAVDADGNPTTDPLAATVGALSPFGGPKGYALGLAIEALVATLTGTALGKAVGGTLDTNMPVSKGDLVLLIQPRILAGTDSFDQVSDYLSNVRSSQPRYATEPVRVPGDGTRHRRARFLEKGLDIDDALWDQLLDCSTTQIHSLRGTLHEEPYRRMRDPR